jgi:uncharacterized membrane protein
VKEWSLRLWRSLCGTGLLLGTLFFAASLAPTLIPRTYLIQGVLGGGVFAIGYGLEVFWRWFWGYMELPTLKERNRRIANLAIASVCAVVAAAFLWRSAEWQNSIRVLMDLEPVTSGHPVKVCAVAVATFVVLLGLARLFTLILRFIAGRLRRVVPRRVANVIGAAVALLVFWSIATEVLFAAALRVLDYSFQQRDALIEPAVPQPASPLKAGSPASLLRWDQLGRAGREFIASGPGAGDISAASGRAAMEPIRVLCRPALGRDAGATRQARARRAQTRRSLRAVLVDRHHSDGDRLGQSGSDGQCRVSP